MNNLRNMSIKELLELKEQYEKEYKDKIRGIECELSNRIEDDDVVYLAKYNVLESIINNCRELLEPYYNFEVTDTYIKITGKDDFFLCKFVKNRFYLNDLQDMSFWESRLNEIIKEHYQYW